MLIRKRGTQTGSGGRTGVQEANGCTVLCG
jgi:hypothetical protein